MAAEALKSFVKNNYKLDKKSLKDNIAEDDIDDVIKDALCGSFRLEDRAELDDYREKGIQIIEFEDALSDKNITILAKSQKVIKFKVSDEFTLALIAMFKCREHPAIFDGIVVSFNKLPIVFFKNKKVDEGLLQYLDLYAYRGNLEYKLIQNNYIFKEPYFGLAKYMTIDGVIMGVFIATIMSAAAINTYIRNI